MLYLAGGLSLLGMTASAVLLVPMLTNLCSTALTPLYRSLLGNEGWLAARNMKGNKTTAQNITLLFISISAVIAITLSVILSQRMSVTSFMGRSLTALRMDIWNRNLSTG